MQLYSNAAAVDFECSFCVAFDRMSPHLHIHHNVANVTWSDFVRCHYRSLGVIGCIHLSILPTGQIVYTAVHQHFGSDDTSVSFALN